MKIPFGDERTDWVKVLELMYEDQMVLPPEDGPYVTYEKRLHPFLYFSDNNLSSADINNTISYLESTNLIEKIKIMKMSMALLKKDYS